MRIMKSFTCFEGNSWMSSLSEEAWQLPDVKERTEVAVWREKRRREGNGQRGQDDDRRGSGGAGAENGTAIKW